MVSSHFTLHWITPIVYVSRNFIIRVQIIILLKPKVSKWRNHFRQKVMWEKSKFSKKILLLYKKVKNGKEKERRICDLRPKDLDLGSLWYEETIAVVCGMPIRYCSTEHTYDSTFYRTYWASGSLFHMFRLRTNLSIHIFHLNTGRSSCLRRIIHNCTPSCFKCVNASCPDMRCITNKCCVNLYRLISSLVFHII